MHSYYKKLLKISYISLGLVSPLFTSAQGGGNAGGSGGSNNVSFNIKIDNPLAGGVKTLPELLTLIITKIINPIGGIVAVIMIMYAGFMYVTARGDTAKIKAAHNAILYAAIGAAILLGANIMALAIQSTVTSIAG